LNGQQIDPGELPDPGDAFARFDTGGDNISTVDAEHVDDAMLDAIAQLPDTTPAVPVVEAAVETPAVVETPVAEEMPAAEGAVETALVAAPADSDLEAELAAACDVAEPPPAPLVEAAPVAGPATVMVVDDSPTIRKILGLTLEKAGYNVVTAADGTAALAQLQDIVPSVVLLDISMPDLDGYEVCKRIKQDPRTSAVPVIMLSGKGAFFDKVKGHMAGATEYLTKPFETPAVLAVVTSHCQPAAEAQHG
jgi:twitching motility two-component system response regulator PilG